MALFLAFTTTEKVQTLHSLHQLLSQNRQTNELLIRAYDIGTYDAYYGDDCDFIDCQSKEQIINNIKS